MEKVANATRLRIVIEGCIGVIGVPIVLFKRTG